MEEVRGVSSRPMGGAPSRPAVIHSLLMIDCGTVFTKVALVGRVENNFRLLASVQAPTTTTAPQADAIAGVREGIAGIERVSGRVLLRDGALVTPEQPDGVGVDSVALATSIGGPVRLLTIGPGREALSALLYRALGGIFAQVEALPAFPTNDYEAQQLVAQIHALHPHALLVVGPPFGARAQGMQGAMETTAQTVAHWLDALRDNAPADESRGMTGGVASGMALGESGGVAAGLPVIYTGEPQDAAPLTAALQGRAAYQVVEPLSPSTLAPLNRTVGALYEATTLPAIPNFPALRALASAPPIATITSLSGVVRYLSQHYKMNVVGVDVGANTTALAGATASGEFLPALHPNAGVGPGAGYILRAVGAQNVLRWLTFSTEENTVREYALMRMLRPHVVPSSLHDIELEYAFTREAIRLALHGPGSRLSGLSPLDVALGTGGVFAHMANPAQGALLLLDALQPRGITSFVLDTAQIATMLGSAGTLAASLAAQVAEGDAVPLPLGPVISTAGSVPDGQGAVRVTLEYADGRQHTETVAQGSLARLPLGLGERALLSLYPAATVDVGLGPGQQARASEPIEGGALGMVVDARGRPLALPSQSGERIARLTAWRRTLGIEA
ncbi:MAG: glutamate mutase L [Ktedonobacterales bacterium]